MNILLLHNTPSEDAAVEDRDVLTQRDAVAAALDELGYTTKGLGCSLDLDQVYRRLIEDPPDLVFNLVESLAGTDRLMPLPSLLLDALQIPYTGAPSMAQLATSSKVEMKQRLREAGLATPAWESEPGEPVWEGSRANGTWIIKPIWEHASIGMDDDAVVELESLVELRDLVRDREQRGGRPLFAERFVKGREFNLSLLGGEVLPPAEIDFSSFPPGKPRIVGRRAKWQPDSYEYRATPRRFDFPARDQSLLAELAELARDCWNLFGLRGFARVDFRVDPVGRPWILEVNVNPCLAPDAGFAAAVAEAGLSYSAAIQRIVAEAGIATTAPVNTA